MSVIGGDENDEIEVIENVFLMKEQLTCYVDVGMCFTDVTWV